MRAVFRHYSHRYNTHKQTSSSALSSEHSTPFIRQQTTTAGKAEPPALTQQVGVASSSSLRPPVTAYSDHPNRKQDGFGRADGRYDVRFSLQFFHHATLCVSAVFAVGRCPSVRPSTAISKPGHTPGLSYWPVTRPDPAKIVDPVTRDPKTRFQHYIMQHSNNTKPYREMVGYLKARNWAVADKPRDAFVQMQWHGWPNNTSTPLPIVSSCRIWSFCVKWCRQKNTGEPPKMGSAGSLERRSLGGGSRGWPQDMRPSPHLLLPRHSWQFCDKESMHTKRLEWAIGIDLTGISDSATVRPTTSCRAGSGKPVAVSV